MIYQCYHDDADLTKAFTEDCYTSLNLRDYERFLPSPAAGIDYCAPLSQHYPEDVQRQLALCEYTALAWQYLYGLYGPCVTPGAATDDSCWIGFTSINQSKYSAWRFRDREAVRDALSGGEIAVWGWTEFRDADNRPLSVGDFSERSHPGITAGLGGLLAQDHRDLPREWWTRTGAPMHNYFACSREQFREYMGWSWPLVRTALEKKPAGRVLAYAAERLFPLWVMLSRRPLKVLAGSVAKLVKGEVEA